MKMHYALQKLISPRTAASDESGSVLLVTLILMVLMTLIGISGINTAATDLQITRNYRIYQQNLVLADAAVNRAAVWLADNLEPDLQSHVVKDYIDAEDGYHDVADLWNNGTGSGYFHDPGWNPNAAPVKNRLDVNAVISDWESLDRAALSSEPMTEYLVFVSATGSENHRGEAVIIARSRKNGGDVVVEFGIGGQ